MRTKHIFETDPLDTEKSATNISDPINKENYSNYNTKWHNYPTGSNKNAKTIIITNHMEDQKNQYKHFF